MKPYLYNFDPLKPHFYIVKLGFTGVYIIFLISAQKHRLWYSLEPPRRGGSNEYPQSMFWAEIWKKKIEFLSENFHILVVKCSVYLNRRVFVMIFQHNYWHHANRLLRRGTCCVTTAYVFFVCVCVCFFCLFFLCVCVWRNEKRKSIFLIQWSHFRLWGLIDITDELQWRIF